MCASVGLGTAALKIEKCTKKKHWTNLLNEVNVDLSHFQVHAHYMCKCSMHTQQFDRNQLASGKYLKIN